jgi:selenocysteine lyase/cysteine desulfurase
VGCRQRVSTAFGERLVTFADYTASGRSLEGIESFIKQEVLPVYANTHTTASATGMQTTLFRAEARSIVR